MWYIGRWPEGAILGFIVIPADVLLLFNFCLTVTNNLVEDKFIFSVCVQSYCAGPFTALIRSSVIFQTRALYGREVAKLWS